MKFKEVRYKNFLSFGNNMTSVKLDTTSINLISGLNGRGKSTILEAIYFGYSGKPFRNIRKNQLVNTLNKGELVVELDISHKGHLYTIRRGIKPDFFEIIMDGNLISEDSTVKDYQVTMETIFGVSAKMMKQTILMSSRFYTPFLELKPSDKRDFIESILSITIFSQMCEVLRSKLSTARQTEKLLDKDIERIQSNIKLLEQVVRQQQDEVNERKNEIVNEIDELKSDIITHESEYKASKQKYDKVAERINALKDALSKNKKLDDQIKRVRFDINAAKKSIGFFNNTDRCPTCEQKIDEELRVNKQIEHERYMIEYDTTLNALLAKMEKFDQLRSKIADLTDKASELNSDMLSINAHVSSTNGQIMRLQREYNRLNVTDVENQTNDQQRLESELIDVQQQIVDLRVERGYMNQTISMLSEKGIKRFIIHKYVPILNGLVNDYLSLLEAPYSIIFDEELDEQIVARGYEKLGYGNFSAGEKQRCDLALLFAFLELSKMKNSVDVNLVFFDEVLDNSLDDRGLEGVFKIFERLKAKGYTIFVISHRDNLDDKFEMTIRVDKKRFSFIEQ